MGGGRELSSTSRRSDQYKDHSRGKEGLVPSFSGGDDLNLICRDWPPSQLDIWRVGFYQGRNRIPAYFILVTFRVVRRRVGASTTTTPIIRCGRGSYGECVRHWTRTYCLPDSSNPGLLPPATSHTILFLAEVVRSRRHTFRCHAAKPSSVIKFIFPDHSNDGPAGNDLRRNPSRN